jgi:hypothetical protein
MREDAQDEFRLRPPMLRRGWDAGGEPWPALAPIALAPRRKRVGWPAWCLIALLAVYLAGIFVVLPLLIQGRFG